jgi:hypothetical protein
MSHKHLRKCVETFAGGAERGLLRKHFGRLSCSLWLISGEEGMREV